MTTTPGPFNTEENASAGLNNVEIAPNTRNSRGMFVKETVYELVEIDATGWALICPDNAMCHYVDPDSLHAAAQRCFL